MSLISKTIKPLKIFFFLFQTYWIVSDFSYDRNIFIIKFDLKKTDISNPCKFLFIIRFWKGLRPFIRSHNTQNVFVESRTKCRDDIKFTDGSTKKQADVGQNTLNAVGSVLFKSNFNQVLIVLPCEPLSECNWLSCHDYGLTLHYTYKKEQNKTVLFSNFKHIDM